jgi:hypothetical protein
MTLFGSLFWERTWGAMATQASDAIDVASICRHHLLVSRL